MTSAFVYFLFIGLLLAAVLTAGQLAGALDVVTG